MAALGVLLLAVAGVAVLAVLSIAPAGLGLLPAAVVAVFSWRFLYVRARQRAEALEWQLSALLRVLSVQLSETDFEDRLLDALGAIERPEPALFALQRDLAAGKPLTESLASFSQNTPSLLAKKAAMQLMLCYQSGKSGMLDAMADELGGGHAVRLQAFAARSAFLSLWFVVLGALVPLMLAAMALVGAAFLPLDMPPLAVLLFFAAGVPLGLLCIVLFAAALRPGGFA